MKDPSRTNAELTKEISALKKRIKELEQSESDRKQVEEALQESENRLREITTQVPGVVYQFYVRPNGVMGLYYISDRSEMVTGLKPDLEGYFERFSAIVIPEHRDGFIKSIEKSVNESSEWKYEGMLQKPSGEMIWFSGNSVPSPREDEIVFNGIVRDITERKQAEKALHESEQRYRAVFENTGTATVIIEADTIISLCNSEFERLSGYARDEIEGRKSWTEFVFREDLDCMIAQHSMRRENHDRALQRYEFRFVSRTGGIRNIYLVTDTIHDTERSVGSLMDITDRKHAEEELKDSEAKYRTIVENTNDAIYIHDFDGNIIDVNENACRMVGYDRDELIGANLAKIDKCWQRPENPEREQLIERGNAVFERENVRKDGSVVFVEVSVKIINPEGKGLVQAFVRDITRRKKAEEELKQHRDNLEQLVRERTAELVQMNEDLRHMIAERLQTEEKLRESEDRYRTAIEYSNDGVSIIRGTKRLFVNRRYAEIFGYEKPEELIGASLSTTVHPDDFRKVKKIAAMRQKGEPVPDRHEYRGIRKNGEIVFIEASSAQITYQGKPATLAYIRDITERKHAEKTLIQAEEKYRNIFENVVEGIFQTKQDGRFFTVNPSLARIYGYNSPEEMVETITDIGSQVYANPHERNKFLRIIQKKGIVSNLELQLKKRDGSTFWASINARTVYDENGNTLYYEGTSEDITKRKKAEIALKKSKEDLEIKSKILEELNTALKVILRQGEEDKKNLEDRVASNVKKLVIPYIEKIKKDRLDPQQRSHLNILETNLNEIVSPFLHTIRQLNLTPRETQIASLVKNGKTTKEIAEIIGVATSAIDSYRNSIRTKLGLNSRKVNLQSYLQSLV